MWLKPKGWCCQQLAQHFERRNERGAFVFAQPADSSAGRNQTLFLLSLRSIDPQFVEQLKALKPLPEMCVSIQTWLCVRFCPWCGVELERHYRDQIKLLVDPALLQEFPCTL